MRTSFFSLAACYFLVTAAQAQTFEQTAAFIVLGGDVDLSRMKLNLDGSVSTPQYTSGLNLTPSQTWTSISGEEGCVVQGFGPNLQTNQQIAVQVHFNHIVGWKSGESDAQRSVVWAVGEDPVFCTQNLPNGSSAPAAVIHTNCANEFDIAGNNLNMDRVGKAIDYLFSKYCHQAARKNAF
ncbi:hypothetical protein [Bradyrhizobium vignae]|uniref:hypothetical protein n=1 Tax=Bradyrhizobium vignae TaxID=1549949 RepID=UPI00100A9525|nr:hypothetical protein [Bradyrhizobium vignae]RXH05823.1 hypothetical protein EAV90_04660 [Bradyrhizobium vignae]